MPYQTSKQVYVPGEGMTTVPCVEYVVPHPPPHRPTPSWHLVWQLAETENPVTRAVLRQILERRTEDQPT